MVLPIVLPRTEHTLSRRDVDPDALKVLYRLQQLGHTAYLVGGSVRDLLLGRRPKDFDIGTSAQPHEIKRAFRNCWIIGRRFRLAHVKFGTKTIEVATFRRQVRADAEEEVLQATQVAEAAERNGGNAELAAAMGESPGDSAAARGVVADARDADSARQRLRLAGRGRVSPRLHHQRAVLRRPRQDRHRLRRRPRRSARRVAALHWRSDGAVPGRSGPHAARRGDGRAAAVQDRPADHRRDGCARLAHAPRGARAAARGVLQDPARRRRPNACSRAWRAPA